METKMKMHSESSQADPVYEQSLFFARKLKALRQEQGLTQDKLAERLAISRGTLINYEHSRAAPPLWLAQRVARLFDVEIDALLGYEKDGETDQ